jgi:hypothetical protein
MPAGNRSSKVVRGKESDAKAQSGGSAARVGKPASAKTREAKAVTTPTRDEIAALAYAIYERGGRVAGRDIENWLQAEAELRTERRS